MFLAEGAGKLLLLVVLIYHCTVAQSSSVYHSTGPAIPTSFNTPQTMVILMLLSVCIYELGNMEQKRWGVSPSVVFSITELESRRKYAAQTHFFEDPYRFCDFCTCIFGLIWLGIAIYTRGQDRQSQLSAVGEKFLLFTTVPLSIGLLRYPACFLPALGQQILTVFLLCQSFLSLLIIFLISGIGFGIVFYGVFRNELFEFGTPGRSLQTLFDSILTNYDTTLFDASPNYAIGVSTAMLFLIWAVFVLFNILIAHASSNYATLSKQAEHWNYLIKARIIQQHSVVYEKSPLCMLPAPLNFISTGVYAFHVYYAWRAKLYSRRLYCISLGEAPVILLYY